MVNLTHLMTTQKKLVYQGKPMSKMKEISPYIPSEELVNAVNIAIFLEKRPLLLKGEPGCGKTRLAEAVANELNLPLFSWYIQSTSRAKDGLYTFDAVKRLYDAQLVQLNPEIKSKVDNLFNYIKLGSLGKAFSNTTQSIILIDEIDKADIDFPNDLLRVLDEQKFTIEEIGKTFKAKNTPLIFITSNDEKDLPDAFLRRCLFHYIKFPNEERLKEIVGTHFSGSSPNLIDKAVERFVELRQKMEKGKSGKKATTSELLDWFAVLRQFPEDEIIAQLNDTIPFPEILLKKWEDHLRYLKAVGYES